MTLDQMMDLLKEGAQTNLGRYNKVNPVFVVFHGSDKLDFIVPDFTDDAAKEHSAEQLRKYVEKVSAYAVGQVSEAYMVRARDAQAVAALRESGVRPSGHPDRVEVLIIRVESRMGLLKTSTAVLERERPGDEKSQGTLRSWEDLSGTEEVGRMTGWFRSAGVTH